MKRVHYRPVPRPSRAERPDRRPPCAGFTEPFPHRMPRRAAAGRDRPRDPVLRRPSHRRLSLRSRPCGRPPAPTALTGHPGDGARPRSTDGRGPLRQVASSTAEGHVTPGPGSDRMANRHRSWAGSDASAMARCEVLDAEKTTVNERATVNGWRLAVARLASAAAHEGSKTTKTPVRGHTRGRHPPAEPRVSTSPVRRCLHDGCSASERYDTQ